MLIHVYSEGKKNSDFFSCNPVSHEYHIILMSDQSYCKLHRAFSVTVEIASV